MTQIFDRRDPHLTNDSVFAVKDSLVVDFAPLQSNPKAQFELAYNFKLASYGEKSSNGVDGATAASTAGDSALDHDEVNGA